MPTRPILLRVNFEVVSLEIITSSLWRTIRNPTRPMLPIYRRNYWADLPAIVQERDRRPACAWRPSSWRRGVWPSASSTAQTTSRYSIRAQRTPGNVICLWPIKKVLKTFYCPMAYSLRDKTCRLCAKLCEMFWSHYFPQKSYFY